MKVKITFPMTITALACFGIITTMLLLLLPVSVTKAQEMSIPPGLQAALFKKIFLYDKTLQGKGDIRVVILHQDKSAKTAKELKKEFNTLKIDAILVKADEFGNNIQNTSVAYVMPDVDTRSIKQLCEENGVLSISGLPELIEKGEVSVGISKKKGKPQIIVNLKRVKAEGHEISAQLQKLRRRS